LALQIEELVPFSDVTEPMRMGAGVASREHHPLRRFAAYDLRVSFSVAVYWPPNEDMGDAIDEVERCLFTLARR